MISWLVLGAQIPGYLRFKSALKNPERAQRTKLKQILTSLAGSHISSKFNLTTNMSYESFRNQVPTTDYEFWKDFILEQKNTGKNILCTGIKRYQPTSGSTSSQKYIPYSKCFMNEMDQAIQAWLGDLGLSSRKAFSGCQYWSLSWLPEAQRALHPGNNDLELLPSWKAHLLEKTMAVPSNVNMTHTMEESQFATLSYLCTRKDITLVSVWSPTFWLVLLHQLDRWQEIIAHTLETGEWKYPSWSSNLIPPKKNKSAADILRSKKNEDLYKTLWPRLNFISCWDSAGSQTWANEIRKKHPGVRVQGKGLWATEGVFTIPFKNRYPAAITSHFFEWIDLDNGQIHPTWELRKGQKVQPLLTSASGLLRYKMCDELVVADFLKNTPTFEFKGRLRETDLVGEKLSNQLVQETFESLCLESGVRPVSMLAVRTKKCRPYYLVLTHECEASEEFLENKIEDSLSRVFNYKLAREMGQLDKVKVRKEQQPEEFYYQSFTRKGMLKGDIKLEALAEISEEFLG